MSDSGEEREEVKVNRVPFAEGRVCWSVQREEGWRALKASERYPDLDIVNKRRRGKQL